MIQHTSEKIFLPSAPWTGCFPRSSAPLFGPYGLTAITARFGTGRLVAAIFSALYFQKAAYCRLSQSLQRCSKTAEVLAQNQIPCLAVTALQEIAMGQWEMLSMEQIKQQQPALYEQRGQCFASFCPPGGESFCSVSSAVCWLCSKLRTVNWKEQPVHLSPMPV